MITVKSLRRGKSILKAEVQGISNHGIWLCVEGAEYFLPYKSYPWFLNATVEQIYNVEYLFGYHLRWPDLDIDLELDALKHPASYPLTYKQGASPAPALCVREPRRKTYGKHK